MAKIGSSSIWAQILVPWGWERAMGFGLFLAESAVAGWWGEWVWLMHRQCFGCQQ